MKVRLEMNGNDFEFPGSEEFQGNLGGEKGSDGNKPKTHQEGEQNTVQCFSKLEYDRDCFLLWGSCWLGLYTPMF